MKFEKFDSRKQIPGLAKAAAQLRFAELTRAGKMPSLDQVVAAIETTRQEYRARFLAARQKKSHA